MTKIRGEKIRRGVWAKLRYGINRWGVEGGLRGSGSLRWSHLGITWARQKPASSIAESSTWVTSTSQRVGRSGLERNIQYLSSAKPRLGIANPG